VPRGGIFAQQPVDLDLGADVDAGFHGFADGTEPARTPFITAHKLPLYLVRWS
jgi:hypothetical protein